MSKLFGLIGKLFRLNRRAYVQYRERRSYLTHGKEYWEDFSRRVLEDQVPIFFLSTGRCGTALLSSIFERIPHVACYHSPVPELVYSARLAYENGSRNFEAYREAILAARFESVADSAIRGKRYVETSCRTTFFAPHLYELFPRSRFVHLVRHPGAFVRSAVLRGYYGGGYDDIGRIRPRDGLAAEKWSAMTEVERSAWLWNETNLFIERFKHSCNPERILTVRAEEVFTDPKATLRILEYCDIERPSSARIAKWTARRVNAAEHTAALPSYELWDEPRKEELRRWASGAVLYGYHV